MSEPPRMASDPFRLPIVSLMIGAFVAAIVGVVIATFSPLFFDGALILALAGAVLYGVWTAQRLRAGWRPDPPLLAAPEPRPYLAMVAVVVGVAGLAGCVAISALLLEVRVGTKLGPAIAGATICLAIAALTILVTRYFSRTTVELLPEGPMLERGSRVVGWAFFGLGLGQLAAAMSLRPVWVVVHVLVLGGIVALCADLIVASRTLDKFELATRLRVIDLLGTRANIVTSLVDGLERTLGIDLRATWALAYVRRRFLPMLGMLSIVGWLSTTISVIGRDELGMIERLGIAQPGPPLAAGIHVHLPWPFDRVLRVPVRQVRMVSIGHESEEKGGPEDVLWAREHAAKEYTLLLGDGHDLLTVDASLQFRIADPHAWTYTLSNPTDVLRASAYRSVMHATANRTLEAALSENVTALTAQIRAEVQADADRLGIGVEVVGFTVGGMHPPVAIAADYEAVVSAELAKTTSIVSAQANRNKLIPSAETDAVVGANAARADGEEQRAAAAGDAWSFRALEAQYHADPGEYRFRRRLETLERGLSKRSFTIVDARILRDGGGLWLNQ